MVVHMVLRRPVPAPALQVRVIWQGVQSGDAPEARWADGTGQGHRWSGTRGVPWLLRDELRQGEEWKVNLRGVPADVTAVSLVMSASVERTVGVLVQPLSGDPNAGVLHPGVTLAPGVVTELAVLHRAGDGWQVVALNSNAPTTAPVPVGQAPTPPPVAPAPVPSAPPVAGPVPPSPASGPGSGTGLPAGWGGPVTDAPGPLHPADRPTRYPDDRTVQYAGPRPGDTRSGTPQSAPPGPAYPASAPATTPALSSGWTDHSAGANTVDQGPQVPIPDRLTGAVDAVRSTGLVRRARVSAVVDVSASMYRWIASGALADVLTATQAVAGAAQRPGLTTRFLPDGTDVTIDLKAEPAAALRDHLSTVGLRTGDRRQLVAALAESGRQPDRDGGTETITLVVTDDPSLAEVAGPGATAVIVGGDARTDGAERAVVVSGPIDVPRLARDLAQRCFMPTRR